MRTRIGNKKKKGLRISGKAPQITYEDKDDIQILAEWGYSHAYIAEKVFGDASPRSLHRVSYFVSQFGLSVRSYRNGTSEIGRANAARILSGYKMKFKTA